MEQQNKQQHRREQRRAYARMLSMAMYIHNLRQRYAKVIAVGVNLTYNNKFQQDVTVDDFLQHLHRFEKNQTHNKIFQHVIGYIFKIELKLKNGLPYVRAIIFLNGNAVQESKMLYHGIRIVKYWSKHVSNYQGIGNVITGQEHFYNGLGLLDNRKYEILRRTYIKYLCKGDDVIINSQGVRIKCLRKGTVKIKVTGRPRKHQLPDLPYFLIRRRQQKVSKMLHE